MDELVVYATILDTDEHDANIADIDECVVHIDVCDRNAACHNTVGSYTCVCNNEYTGHEQTCSCKDVYTLSYTLHTHMLHLYYHVFLIY